MIKVTLGEVKTQEEKPFPKLMIGKYNCIILAIDEDEGHYYGTLIYKGSSDDTLGEFSYQWKKKYFSDYNDPITLQNA